MKIIDLAPEHERLYFCCLEDWSDEMKESGNHKENWYNQMKNKGLRVKLAQDDHGVVGGMIQYIPIEYSFFEGKDLFVVLCIWVHGYKDGRGNFMKKGMGKALLKAAEEDAIQLGSKGLVTWGLWLPFFMRASWFKKHGYKTVDKDGFMRLLWKPFSQDAVPPKFIKLKKKPEKIPGKINVSVFTNGWCPAQAIVHERARRAIAGYEDKVVFNEFWTNDRQILNEWGLSDALYIDNESIRNGPPTKYEKIRKIIEKKVKKIKVTT